MNYYSLNDIVDHYRISKQTLKKKIALGEIDSVKYEWESERGYRFCRYFISENELSKIERFKISEPTPSKYSPEEWYFINVKKKNMYLKTAGETKKFVKYNEYINSPEWQQKKAQREKLDDYRCQRCGSAKNLQCHHLTYDNLGDEKMEDLITLCRSCHKEIHEKDIKR